MTRGGRTKDRTEPERRCIATGEVQTKHGLIRFVVGPDGFIVPDLAEKLPGRGMWVEATVKSITRAATKGLFARAAGQPVQVPADLAALVEGLLVRRVVELLGLARKAGLAVAGYEKVRDWLVKGQAVLLIQAADGSERGKGKLHPPTAEVGGKSAFIGCLTAAELGLAFGREHVIHGALAAGGLTIRVVEEAARLAGLRGQTSDSVAAKDTKDA